MIPRSPPPSLRIFVLLGGPVFIGCRPVDDSSHPVDTDATDTSVDTDSARDTASDTEPDTDTALSDIDGDGWTVDEGDCDDARADVNPGAAEICDGVDDDCDGALGTAELDLDVDGITACDGDCNDADATIHPGTSEACNGIDDDCDGTIDVLLDLDGDGFGGCDGDCDDADPAVHPGATEICSNGIDDDCDGTANGCDLRGDIPLSDADALILGQDADDAAGTVIAPVGDLDSDGYDDFCLTAPANRFLPDGTPAEYGYGFTFYGPVATGTHSMWEGPDFQTWSEAQTLLVGVGDSNGDGNDDFLVGTPYYGDHDGGQAVLYYGYRADRENSSYLTFTGSGGYSNYGIAIAGADLDGDGLSDVVIGSGTRAEMYVVDGPPRDPNLQTADHTGSGGSGFGTSLVTPGDMDGDGYGDLAVGALNRDEVFVFAGPLRSSFNESDAIGVLDTSGSSATTLGLAGDPTGDGVPDFLVGSDIGSAWLVDGAGVAMGSTSLADDFRIRGDAAEDWAGASVSPAGDIDGDGFDDLILGTSGLDAGAGEGGGAYVVYGPTTTDLSLRTDSDARILGDTAWEAVGVSAAGAGDLDGDGFGDILVGSSTSDRAAINAGAVWVFHGRGQ